MNPIDKMKAAAKEGWSTFAPFESFTGSAAPHLVRFAGINKGDRVLDVGCGTGVLTLTAARAGGIVTGADLTPQLLERARENARLAGLEAKFEEFEINEEHSRIAPLVLAAVSDRTEFDLATHELKGLLAEELEDGD